jgi:hypothetical protein
VAWTSKKPSLEHFRVFGHDSYVYVPKENWSRIDNKDEMCICIVYKDGMKGYKVWNPKTKKIVYIQYVLFRKAK